MKKVRVLIVFVYMMTVVNFASADTIRGIDINFVTIGNVGNAGDTRTGTDESGHPWANPYGSGAVDYNYRIGKYEVTNAQWNTFTAAAGKYNEALQTAMQNPNYQKALLIQKKWQHLKQGLSEEDIRNILGKPKCIQAASDHCIWYYQATPMASQNNEGNYECSIPQSGYVRFGIVGIETIIEINEKTYQKYMDDEQKAHEKFLAKKPKEMQDANSEHAIILSKIREGHINPNHSRPGSYLYRTEQERYEAYQAEIQRHDREIQLIQDSIEKEKQRYRKRIEKLSQEIETKLSNLVNGLSPMEPRYIASDWTLPDQNDLVSLLESEEIKEKRIKPSHKWQMPIKWKSLRLNIKEEEAYSILGSPSEILSEPGKKIYCYGRITEYGFLTFEEGVDSLRRLRCWKEPLWAYVTQELQSENQQSDPNQDVGIGKVNEPNGFIEPDANDMYLPAT